MAARATTRPLVRPATAGLSTPSPASAGLLLAEHLGEVMRLLQQQGAELGPSGGAEAGFRACEGQCSHRSARAVEDRRRYAPASFDHETGIDCVTHLARGRDPLVQRLGPVRGAPLRHKVDSCEVFVDRAADCIARMTTWSVSFCRRADPGRQADSASVLGGWPFRVAVLRAGQDVDDHAVAEDRWAEIAYVTAVRRAAALISDRLMVTGD